VLGLAQDLPRVWRGATAEERKRILRLVVSEVVLDQKRERGLVWMRVAWQTGASSEHTLRRNVRGYAQCADTALLRRRLAELNRAGMMDREVAAALNAEGLRTAHGAPFTGNNVHCLRKRWGIATVKTDGVAPNPERWPDGSYSVQGAAAALGVAPQTVFKRLRQGRLAGRQRAKGQPWQVMLPEMKVAAPVTQDRRIRRSRREAS